MRLYHGSTVTVRKPSLRPGRSNADFGKGFYTTSVLEQAVRWAHIKQEREDAARAVVSVYEFDKSLLDNTDLKIRQFTGADEPWLLFVTGCRKSRPHEYDLVQGPVANDKVFTTVNLFESGLLSANAAILQLKAYKTYDQLSFHTPRVIGTLKFVESFDV
jgi:hypothetical protein